MASICSRHSWLLKGIQEQWLVGSFVKNMVSASVPLKFLHPTQSPYILQQRLKTTQKYHKATKKGRLTLRDQKILKEKHEFESDPMKNIMGMLKKAGIKPGRPANKRPITITSTADFFEQYVPPEGDGKASILSPEGAKQRAERLKNVGVARMALRKIHNFEPEFTSSEFAWKAQQIFIDVHKNLVDFDEDVLHTLVTEKCYPEITKGMDLKTLRWTFVESIEKPRVVHIRCSDMMTKNNVYAQVTVRMLSKQILAIYDRFGRLLMGSEEVPKDVLEYVVFEKHLPNRYGTWRLHGKIVPEWATHQEPVISTMVLPEPKEQSEETTNEGTVTEASS